METKHAARGGARKNAGRKTELHGEEMSRVQVTVDAMTYRRLLVLGAGNVSKGVREAAGVAYDRYQKQEIANSKVG